MTLLVRLTDEPVDVWRPVDSVELGDGVRMIAADQAIPQDEEWEFQPGEHVETEIRSRDGTDHLFAVRKHEGTVA